MGRPKRKSEAATGPKGRKLSKKARNAIRRDNAARAKELLEEVIGLAEEAIEDVDSEDEEIPAVASVAVVQEEETGQSAAALKMPEPKKRKAHLSNEQRLASGLLVSSEEHKRIYCQVAYNVRFNDPPREDWNAIANEISQEIDFSPKSIIRVFEKCFNGEDASKRKAGSGRKRKLKEDSVGLIAAAMALNTGA